MRSREKERERERERESGKKEWVVGARCAVDQDFILSVPSLIWGSRDF
jgi:hypothetical protein